MSKLHQCKSAVILSAVKNNASYIPSIGLRSNSVSGTEQPIIILTDEITALSLISSTQVKIRKPSHTDLETGNGTLRLKVSIGISHPNRP